jgi:hypothetical protein
MGAIPTPTPGAPRFAQPPYPVGPSDEEYPRD